MKGLLGGPKGLQNGLLGTPKGLQNGLLGTPKGLRRSHWPVHGVRWGVTSQGPNVDVLLDCVPSQGGVLVSSLPEELIVSDTLLTSVVREKHGHQCLVLGQLEC